MAECRRNLPTDAGIFRQQIARLRLPKPSRQFPGFAYTIRMWISFVVNNRRERSRKAREHKDEQIR